MSKKLQEDNPEEYREHPRNNKESRRLSGYGFWIEVWISAGRPLVKARIEGLWPRFWSVRRGF